MQWFSKEHLGDDQNHHLTDKIKILDVGSYDVNGSYRQFFASERFIYTGLDMEAGPNVDLVPEHPYQWDEIAADSYDVVISGQALEHIEFFWVTISEMVRVLKKDGLLCIVAPNGFGEHRYPVDCWRFFTDGMIALARYTKLELIHAHTNAAPSADLTAWFSSQEADSMLIARKPYSGSTQTIDLRSYKCVPADHAKTMDGFLLSSNTNQSLKTPAPISQASANTKTEAVCTSKGQKVSILERLNVRIRSALKRLLPKFKSNN